MWLTRAALAHPIAVTLFYLAIALLGWVALASMGRGLLPNVEIPSIAVTATYPGAAPREMEQLVVKPIEDALDAVPNIERVTASSQNGFAQIVAQFRFGVDVREAQSDVQQAVDAARANMPADLLPPIVVRDDPTQIPVIEFAVSSAVYDRAKLAAFWIVRSYRHCAPRRVLASCAWAVSGNACLSLHRGARRSRPSVQRI